LSPIIFSPCKLLKGKLSIQFLESILVKMLVY
jgi:hypothetical protein